MQWGSNELKPINYSWQHKSPNKESLVNCKFSVVIFFLSMCTLFIAWNSKSLYNNNYVSIMGKGSERYIGPRKNKTSLKDKNNDSLNGFSLSIIGQPNRKPWFTPLVEPRIKDCHPLSYQDFKKPIFTIKFLHYEQTYVYQTESRVSFWAA